MQGVPSRATADHLPPLQPMILCCTTASALFIVPRSGRVELSAAPATDAGFPFPKRTEKSWIRLLSHQDDRVGSDVRKF